MHISDQWRPLDRQRPPVAIECGGAAVGDQPMRAAPPASLARWRRKTSSNKVDIGRCSSRDDSREPAGAIVGQANDGRPVTTRGSSGVVEDGAIAGSIQFAHSRDFAVRRGFSLR